MQFVLDGINTSILIVASINILLGILIYANKRKAVKNRIYIINIIAIIAWILGMFLYRSAVDSLIFWAIVLYIPPTFIAGTFLYFTYFFPLRDVSFLRLKTALIFILNIILATLVVFPGAVIESVFIRPGMEKSIVFGPWYWLYAVYIISFFTFGLSRLFIKMFRSRNTFERRQILYLLIGYFIAANPAMATNLVLPLFGYFELNWLGQIFTIFMVMSVTYAIVKLRLFNLKVIMTELLVFIIWVAIFVEVLLAETIKKGILKGGLFVFTVIFGVLIIKSVLNEVRRKEELEKISGQLAAANARLKELDKLKSDFVSIASHHLRSPLTVIKGYGSMILEGSFGEISGAVKNAVEKIFQSSERLIDFVNDLLDVSRIERGKMQYNFEKTDIFGIVSSVVEEFQLTAKKKVLILEFKKETAEIPPFKLKLDANKIRQIILNFIDNAIKYTPQGGIIVNILKTGKRVEIKVKDTGIGVDKKDQKKIFEQFMRIGGANAVGGIGAGLGLYVARKIALAHNGEVAVESEGKGRGSTFILRLPL